MILDFFKRKQPDMPLSGQTVRSSRPQGPFTAEFSGWVPRQTNPHLYELVREAIPILDAVASRLVGLDGVLAVEAESDALQSLLDDWMEGVKVNDLQQGLQAFYAGQGNELYEQGFTVGAYELSRKKNDIDRLRVADSKYALFFRDERDALQTWYQPRPETAYGRRDGTDRIEQLLAGTVRSDMSQGRLTAAGFRLVDPRTMIYAGLDNENNNPYGVSIYRSLPFVAKILLTIQNSMLQTWTRFGDPVFNVLYKSSIKLEDPAAKNLELAKNLATALEAKRAGKSVDFVNTIGKNDELTTQILGAGADVLDLAPPMTALLDQILSKTGIPPWMLNLDRTSNERVATKQAEVMLQDARTRFALRKPALTDLLATMLRARGATWKRGDWQLVQQLPNIADMLNTAQAEFMQAQTQLMMTNAGNGEYTLPVAGGPVDRPADGDPLPKIWQPSRPIQLKNASEPPVDPAVFAQANYAVRALQMRYRTLREQVIDLLGLRNEAQNIPVAEKSTELGFVFLASALLPQLEELEALFLADVSAEDAPYMQSLIAAWLQGRQSAAREINYPGLITQIQASEQAQLATFGLSQLRDTFKRLYRDEIIAELSAGIYDGQERDQVARALLQRFGGQQGDWARLVNSEIAEANAAAKIEQYAEMEVETYDYITAQDSKVSEICRAHERAGPYPVGQGPIPMRDSHPNCRCSVRARA